VSPLACSYENPLKQPCDWYPRPLSAHALILQTQWFREMCFSRCARSAFIKLCISEQISRRLHFLVITKSLRDNVGYDVRACSAGCWSLPRVSGMHNYVNYVYYERSVLYFALFAFRVHQTLSLWTIFKQSPLICFYEKPSRQRRVWWPRMLSRLLILSSC